MKQIKPGEYTSKVCHECGCKATWRATRTIGTMYACDDHKQDIVEAERLNQDDGHMSEGDHQSWGRL